MSDLPQNAAFEIFGIHSMPFISDHHQFSEEQFTYRRTIPEQWRQPMPQTVGTVLLALFIGSGSPPQAYISLNEISPPSQIQTSRSAAQQIYPADVSDILATIRSAFPLQISQIAEILGVSRPTIYAWLNNEQQPQSLTKLSQIYALAEFWNDRCNLPAPEKTFELPDSVGVSLIDMLKAPSINVATVKNRLEDLVRTVKGSVRLGMVEAARLRGFKLPAGGNNTAEFDVTTRRPMDES